MDLKNLKIELLKKDKNIKWLINELGYSRTYLYRVLEIQHKEQLNRIKKILMEVK